MSRCKSLLVVALLFVGTGAVLSAPHYYGNRWYSGHNRGGQTYYYTHYYYDNDNYHHCYYYPYVSNRYVYYYNWRTHQYWGRYDCQSNQYSLLPEGKKKERLEQIAENDFPPPQPLEQITIPGSNEKMTAPPPLPRNPKDPGPIAP